MAEQTQTKEKKRIERPTNCMKCNKRLQKKVRYYRNGAYYCSKRCWKQAVVKKKEEQAQAATKKKEEQKKEEQKKEKS